MAEKEFVDFFQEVFPKAKEGPAKKFFDGNVSDDDLKEAYVKVEYACMNRRGLNPYRADMAEEMEEHNFYKDVSDGELEATRALLVVLTKMRAAVPTVAELAGKKVELAKVLDGDNQKKE